MLYLLQQVVAMKTFNIGVSNVFKTWMRTAKQHFKATAMAWQHPGAEAEETTPENTPQKKLTPLNFRVKLLYLITDSSFNTHTFYQSDLSFKTHRCRVSPPW